MSQVDDNESVLCLEEEDGLVWFESDFEVFIFQKNINRVRHIARITWVPWSEWDEQGRSPTVALPNPGSKQRCREELSRMFRSDAIG